MSMASMLISMFKKELLDNWGGQPTFFPPTLFELRRMSELSDGKQRGNPNYKA